MEGRSVTSSPGRATEFAECDCAGTQDWQAKIAVASGDADHRVSRSRLKPSSSMLLVVCNKATKS